MEKVEIRNFELRASDDQVTLYGYAIRWDDVSKPLPFLERFTKGAFRDCLSGTMDILALQDHDTTRVLGRRSNNTLELEEDEHGLRVEIRPNTGTSYGKDLVALVSRRDVSGVSLGFKVKDDEWDNQNGKQLRTVNKADIVEVSIVSSPAYASGMISKRGLQIIQGDDKNMKPKEREIRQKIEELETRLADENTPAEELTGAAKELRELRGQIETTGPSPFATARNPEREAIEQRQIFNHYLRTGQMETRQFTPMKLDTGSAGGYTADDQFHAEVIKALSDLSCMRQIARIVAPITGTNATFPRLVSGDPAAMVAEGAEISENDLVFNQLTLTPKKAAAMVPVSNELLHDSSIDLAGFLSQYFAEAIADLLEDNYLNQDASGAQMNGILNSTNLDRVTAAGASAIVAADLLTLWNGLPAKYRGNAVWVMHPSIQDELRPLQVDNRYILVSDFTQAMGNTIFGRPVYLSEQFPDTSTTGLDVMALGDFKRGIYIGDSHGIQVERNEGYYFNRDCTAFRCIFRSDIAVAIKPAVKVMDMA